VEKQCTMEPSYAGLITLSGIGKILGLSMMLETGPITRFPEVGIYRAKVLIDQCVSGAEQLGGGTYRQ